ncbi:peptidylprolyl isomerase [Jannaschia pohangensis]|uniref:Parvulin-like PPIase n=1 Tax=Jannaschia pohangensis TaxID=390807 RepID=A0A1I3T4W0_9RHOB|nr:peptidylprolyl isomerase [Jannaschia pohangensis]SFJ66084.1 peptidyl-prolyl cis-trans isomerase C [Jannaschia pohangensis]
MTRLLTSAALALTLALPAQAQDASTVLATVNGTDITLGHVIALRDRLPPQYQQLPDGELFDGILEQMIQQQVMVDTYEQGPADVIGLENEVRTFIASRALDKIAEADLDEAAVQAAYDATFGAADPEMEYNASHILVETEEEARALIAELDGGADFAELAREKSTGPSGPNGGQLGWFGKGMMVPAFEEAVVSMEVGTVSEPIKTQFGWHVIRLNEARNSEVPSLDEVRADLEAEVRQAAIEAELARLAAGAEITRSEVEIDPALIRNTDLLTE